MPTTTGTDLELARVRAKLTKTAVAKALGTTRATLWVWENAAEVDPEKAAAYLKAVADLRDARETPQGEAA